MPLGIGTITNDDAAGSISVNDPCFAEGNAGTTAGSFTLTRTGRRQRRGQRRLCDHPAGRRRRRRRIGCQRTADRARSISPRARPAPRSPSSINGDITNEPNETFTVALSNPIGGVDDRRRPAPATITNDEPPPGHLDRRRDPRRGQCGRHLYHFHRQPRQGLGRPGHRRLCHCRTAPRPRAATISRSAARSASRRARPARRSASRSSATPSRGQ